MYIYIYIMHMLYIIYTYVAGSHSLGKNPHQSTDLKDLGYSPNPKHRNWGDPKYISGILKLPWW